MEGSNTVSLSNRYGYRVAPGGNGGTFHAGIDIPAEKGAVVKAAAAGTVTEAAFDADRGNYVVLDHGEGMETVYAHCLSLSVETGETVETGQEIAAVGAQLAEKMLEYGCTEALNLDGGDTVALAFNNKVILHGNMESKKLRNLGSMIAFGLK